MGFQYNFCTNFNLIVTPHQIPVEPDLQSLDAPLSLFYDALPVFDTSYVMDNLSELLQPRWGSEKWILEGWEKINKEEQKLITARLDELFKKGLPFTIKHDKILYIYAFSLLAQLEVLAIQIPLKFKDKMASQENRARMHQQLLDEIFHGLVFTKILYLLCDPHAIPPEYNRATEDLCNHLRNEECPKTAVMMLNLIAEGWIEEAFKAYAQQNIAPEVFRTILADEHRHVCEADLYRDIGMPDINVIKAKMEHLEEQLLVSIFLQHRYMVATSALLGMQGVAHFIHSLNKKHHEQLAKINLTPSKKWTAFMHLVQDVMPKIHEYSQAAYEVEMTPMRKVLMTQWDNPSDATMVSQANIDVSCLDFFDRKLPSETLTTLMLQSVSLCLKNNEAYRTYLHFRKLYRTNDAYVGVVVQLPHCRDHMGTIVFKNCHEMSVYGLAQRIRDMMELMVYCYQKREELEQKYPYLEPYDESKRFDFAYDIYGMPLPGSSLVTVSNIGPWGYTDAKSPLLKNEAVKIVMLQVERRQVWDKESQSFVIRDHLPISISADHRLYDGNAPTPRILNETFQEMFQKMHKDKNKADLKPINLTHFKKMIDVILSINIDLGYKYLNALQTFCPDFFAPEDLFRADTIKKAAELIM